MINTIGAFKLGLKTLFYRFGYHIGKSNAIWYFEPLLHHLSKKRDDLLIVEIGANDGRMNDPIYQFIKANHDNIKAIVVEPLKDIFKQLKYNYRKYPNVILVNIAIHNTEKEMTLYRVDPAKQVTLDKITNNWSSAGIASFNKDHHKLTYTPSDFIIPEKVKCLSFDELLKAHDVTKIDILVIDTEGYDYEIITNINFDIIRPHIIRFEHGLADGIMSKEKLLRLFAILRENGYQIAIERFDATAYLLSSFMDFE